MGVAGSWSDFIDAQESERFVGREQELDAFRHEITRLTLSQVKEPGPSWLMALLFLLGWKRRGQSTPEQGLSETSNPSPQYFIFYISGQGGVGKTTLLNRYREIARTSHFFVAESDERQKDVPSLLGHFAQQLEEQGAPLKRFNDRYKTYRQKMHEIENDPDAPQGWGGLLGRVMVRAAFVGADMLPGARKAVEYLPQDALEDQASEWSAYLIKKAFSRDDVALIRDPASILTTLFFKDVNEIAEKHPVLFFFENFEVTRSELQEWLLHLPEYRPSQRIRIAIAGRTEATSAGWDKLRNVMLPIHLDTFTPQEAERFLDRYHIVDQQRRKEILEYSGRLPVIMSWLAASGDKTTEIAQPAHNIVERFLQWVAEPALREVALRGAFPRVLNLDILKVLLQSQSPLLINEHQAFDWLQMMPFVKPRSDGWQYHDVVRRMMLRYQRAASPQTYRETHALLAELYHARREELALSGTAMWTNEDWRKYTLAYCYHFLVANPNKHWGAILNIFTLALRRQRPFAREILDLLSLEDVQTELASEQNARIQLFRQILKKLQEGTIQDGFELFDTLCKTEDISSEARGHMLAYRGECYRLNGQLEEALKDLDSAVQLLPGDSRTIARRSIVYILMKNYEKALADLDQALALDEKDVWTWTIALRGETYRRLGRYQEALADLNWAIDLDAKLAWAIAMRGETHRQMGNYEAALVDFSRASILDSQDHWVAERLALTSQRALSARAVAQQGTSISATSMVSPSSLGEGQPPIPYPTSAATAPTSYADYLHMHQQMPPIPPTPQTPYQYIPANPPGSPPDPQSQPPIPYLPQGLAPIPPLPYGQPPIPPVPMARRGSRSLLLVACLILVVLMLIIGGILVFSHLH